MVDYFEPDEACVLLSKSRILPNSVASEWADVIAEWLGAKEPLTLKWQSNDASDVKGFHDACDGVANTLVIVKSNEGNVFGGFSVPAWDSTSGDFKADPTGLSFLFVLNNSFGVPPTRFRLHDKTKAILCSAGDGPSFGEGCTLSVRSSYYRCSYVRFYPLFPSYVDALGRGVAGFVSSGDDDPRQFDVDSYEIWAASGPPTACA